MIFHQKVQYQCNNGGREQFIDDETIVLLLLLVRRSARLRTSLLQSTTTAATATSTTTTTPSMEPFWWTRREGRARGGGRGLARASHGWTRQFRGFHYAVLFACASQFLEDGTVKTIRIHVRWKRKPSTSGSWSVF